MNNELIPMTPEEQQQAIADATLEMNGNAEHDVTVLATMYRRLQMKVPLLEEAIAKCPVCRGSYEGCYRCKADRAELAALLGY